MNNEQINLFRHVCFIALMQHGKGLISKSPSYIKQKMKTCQCPLAAWQMLDFEGQEKVMQWASYVNFPIKDFIHEIAEGL